MVLDDARMNGFLSFDTQGAPDETIYAAKQAL